MVLNLEEEIANETFDKIVKAYNDLKENDFLHIYLKTNGGDSDSADAITHLINQNCERTVLIAYGNILSAGFNIFFNVYCERKILPGTVGMAHLTNISIRFASNNDANSEWDRAMVEWMKENYGATIAYYEALGVDNKDMRSIKKNKEVYFNYMQLNCFLKNHIKSINAEYV